MEILEAAFKFNPADSTITIDINGNRGEGVQLKDTAEAVYNFGLQLNLFCQAEIGKLVEQAGGGQISALSPNQTFHVRKMAVEPSTDGLHVRLRILTTADAAYDFVFPAADIPQVAACLTGIGSGTPPNKT